MNEVDQQLDIQRRNLFQVESGLAKLEMPDAFRDQQRARAEHLKGLIKSLEQQRDSILQGHPDGG